MIRDIALILEIAVPTALLSLALNAGQWLQIVQGLAGVYDTRMSPGLVR